MQSSKSRKGTLAVHVKLLETIFDMIPTAVLAKDLDGNMLLGNQAAESLLGFGKDGISQQTDETLGIDPGDNYKMMREDDRFILETGHGIEKVKKVLLKGRGEQWMHLKKGPFMGADGNIAGFVASWNNITAQRIAEEKLRESESRYRDLVEGSVQGIMVIGEDRYLFANEACARIYGYDNIEEILSLKVCHDLIAPADRERSKRYAKARLEGRDAPTHFEVQGLRKDGSSIFLETIAALINWDGKKAIQVTYTDVTEIKQTRAEQLDHKLEALGTLARGIAGEVSDILGRVTISLARARMEAYSLGIESITAYLADTEHVADEAQELINQLVLIFRGGAPTKELVSIPELIAQCATGYSRWGKVVEIKRRNHAVSINIDSDLPLIMADRLQITQVLNALLSHAAGAMPFGGRISISAKLHTVKDTHRVLPVAPTDYIKISVKDNGERIAGERLLRIFDPYYATKKESSGEGLSSAYAIVKNHGGTITANSGATRGARMTVFLPIGELPREAQPG